MLNLKGEWLSKKRDVGYKVVLLAIRAGKHIQLPHAAWVTCNRQLARMPVGT
jgi:hypothetical protein